MRHIGKPRFVWLAAASVAKGTGEIHLGDLGLVQGEPQDGSRRLTQLWLRSFQGAGAGGEWLPQGTSSGRRRLEAGWSHPGTGAARLTSVRCVYCVPVPHGFAVCPCVTLLMGGNPTASQPEGKSSLTFLPKKSQVVPPTNGKEHRASSDARVATQAVVYEAPLVTGVQSSRCQLSLQVKKRV